MISDIVHLFKKLRNMLLSSSDDPSGPRCLEWQGHVATWAHVKTAYEEDSKSKTYQVCILPGPWLSGLGRKMATNKDSARPYSQSTRVRREHVYLTNWSKMRVDYASAVMSDNVVEFLSNEPYASATRGTVVIYCLPKPHLTPARRRPRPASVPSPTYASL